MARDKVEAALDGLIEEWITAEAARGVALNERVTRKRPRGRLYILDEIIIETTRRQLLTTLAAVAGLAALDTAGHCTRRRLPDSAGGSHPSHLAPNASPRFRGVAERLLVAMAEHQVPGAALGILADGRERRLWRCGP